MPRFHFSKGQQWTTIKKIKMQKYKNKKCYQTSFNTLYNLWEQ